MTYEEKRKYTRMTESYREIKDTQKRRKTLNKWEGCGAERDTSERDASSWKGSNV